MPGKSTEALVDRPEAAGTDRPGGGLERVTVNLTRRSARALERAVGVTGDSKTDTVNRALQVYAYLEEVLEAGGTVLVQEAGDPAPQRLRIF